jgi:hypothetical protein
MVSLIEQIREELDGLPEAKLRRVLDFVESLKQPDSEESNYDPLLAIAGILSGPALSSEEIDRELYGGLTEGNDA